MEGESDLSDILGIGVPAMYDYYFESLDVTSTALTIPRRIPASREHG